MPSHQPKSGSHYVLCKLEIKEQKQGVDVNTLMMIRGASSQECAENSDLKNSFRNPLGRVSETTGVSGTSSELIREHHVRGHILWKPEVIGRGHRQYVFSGRYRNVMLP